MAVSLVVLIIAYLEEELRPSRVCPARTIP